MTDKFDIIDEEDGWLLLERKSINERTLVCWYNPNDQIISLSLFHLTEQPNILSQMSPYTTWGYVTHMETKMYTCEEAANVVSLYLQDIEKENFWWEGEK